MEFIPQLLDILVKKPTKERAWKESGTEGGGINGTECPTE